MLRQHLPDEILADRTHPISRALLDAFHSLEAWDRLEHAIGVEHTHGEHRPLALAVKWIDRYGHIARAQIPSRDPNGLNSTGPVEQILREIDRRTSDRVGSFTNRVRLAKLLNLMTLDLLAKPTAANGPIASENDSTSQADAPRTSDPTTKGVHSLFL